MTYSIVVRGAALYGGLAVPRVHPSFKVSNSDLIEFLKDRLRDRPGAGEPLHTVYVPDPAGNWNALVAREYATPADVPVGDLMLRVPKGIYARFAPNGDSHDPVERVGPGRRRDGVGRDLPRLPRGDRSVARPRHGGTVRVDHCR